MYYIENETKELIDLKKVGKILKLITAHFGEKRDFSVTFVDDEEIRRLNSEYRNMDNPTDILTFRLDDGESSAIVWDGEEEEVMEEEEMGDIFISMDSMRRNAKEFGVDEEEELSRLLLHGVLHLRGMDHETNDFSTEPMLIEQERIMSLLKLKVNR